MTHAKATLILSIEQLTQVTEALLKSHASFATQPDNNAYTRGLMAGILQHWFILAIKTGLSSEDCEAEHTRLAALADQLLQKNGQKNA